MADSDAEGRPQVREGEQGRGGRSEVPRLPRHLAALHDPDQRAERGRCSRRAAASTARRSAAGSRSTPPTCSSMPDPATAVIDPFMALPDAQPDLQHRRPDHQGGLHARSAQHRAQGRGVPQVDRHRRRRVLRSGARVLHLRRRPLRAEPAHRLLLRSTRPRGSGTRARPTGRRRQVANLGYKPRYKEGYFPVAADRHAAGHPRRDGARDGEGRASASRSSTTRWRPPARPRSTCASCRS